MYITWKLHIFCRQIRADYRQKQEDEYSAKLPNRYNVSTQGSIRGREYPGRDMGGPAGGWCSMRQIRADY